MNRRLFLKTAACLTALTTRPHRGGADNQDATGRVMTVSGLVGADQLGRTLPHEHVMVDFIGADRVSPQRYQADEVFQVMLPHIRRARQVGCQTIAECTPAYLGRDPALLRRLSEATGMIFLTNTGYYAARQGKFLPGFVYRQTAQQLARRWTAEFEQGIDGTGIRPGFIKIGVDAGNLSSVNVKLIEAAARCHLETGLTIAAHTGDGRAALQQMEILKRLGVSPAAWIWVHAQNERDPELHLRAARAGAWIEFDGVGPNSIDRHVDLVTRMRQAGLLHRVLLSHDAGWYSVGQPRGGKVRGMDTLFTEFSAALTAAGFSPEEITQLLITNPAGALTIAVRDVSPASSVAEEPS